jgi:hypothetical protein
VSVVLSPGSDSTNAVAPGEQRAFVEMRRVVLLLGMALTKVRLAGQSRTHRGVGVTR